MEDLQNLDRGTKVEIMNKKKLLVCGATGFIGRNLAEYFSKKDEFEVYGTYFNSSPYENSRINFIKTDLRNPEDVQKAVTNKDIIIHMAATTSGAKDIINKPYMHVTDNAVISSLLLRVAYDNNVSHFIFPSCTVMYKPSENAIREDDFNPSDEILKSYFGVAWTKVYIEKMCEFYSRLGKTKHTVLRHSNVYGPYDKYDLEKSHVFGATITKVMTAEEGSSIVVWGDGEEERDLIHVNDLCAFIDLSLNQKTSFELVNVGAGESISVKGLVEKVIKHSGKNLSITFDKTKPSIKTKICLDVSKVKDIFAWEKKISLDDGIIDTIEWYKLNKINKF